MKLFKKIIGFFKDSRELITHYPKFNRTRGFRFQKLHKPNKPMFIWYTASVGTNSPVIVGFNIMVGRLSIWFGV